MDQSTIISQLKKVKPALLKKYGVTELALFGSYSRNEQNTDSDIDIMVSLSKPVGLKFFDLVYDLEKLFTHTKIQVVSKAGVKAKYFERIKSDIIYA